MPYRLNYFLVDNNGKEAKFGLWLPDERSIASAISYAQALAPALQGLSNASLVRAELTAVVEFSDLNPPSIDSDCFARLIAVFTSEDETRAITIPSPGNLPFDVGGSLRGIRLGREAALLSGLLTPLQSLVDGDLTPWGTPHPATFVVAGISRGVL